MNRNQAHLLQDRPPTGPLALLWGIWREYLVPAAVLVFVVASLVLGLFVAAAAAS